MYLMNPICLSRNDHSFFWNDQRFIQEININKKISAIALAIFSSLEKMFLKVLSFIFKSTTVSVSIKSSLFEKTSILITASNKPENANSLKIFNQPKVPITPLSFNPQRSPVLATASSEPNVSSVKTKILDQPLSSNPQGFSVVATSSSQLKDSLVKASSLNIPKAPEMGPEQLKSLLATCNTDADRKVKSEAFCLEELISLSQDPSWERYRLLPLSSMYLVAGRYTYTDTSSANTGSRMSWLSNLWNVTTLWSISSGYEILKDFEKRIKREFTTDKVKQAIEEAIQIREKILFIVLFRKTLNRGGDLQHIATLNPKLFNEIKDDFIKAVSFSDFEKEIWQKYTLQKNILDPILEEKIKKLEGGYITPDLPKSRPAIQKPAKVPPKLFPPSPSSISMVEADPKLKKKEERWRELQSLLDNPSWEGYRQLSSLSMMYYIAQSYESGLLTTKYRIIEKFEETFRAEPHLSDFGKAIWKVMEIRGQLFFIKLLQKGLETGQDIQNLSKINPRAFNRIKGILKGKTSLEEPFKNYKSEQGKIDGFLESILSQLKKGNLDYT